MTSTQDRLADALDAAASRITDESLRPLGTEAVTVGGGRRRIPLSRRLVPLGAAMAVLAVVGLCLASGADYDEAAALGNVAGGLEVEKIGVALLSRQEILRDLIEHHRF